MNFLGEFSHLSLSLSLYLSFPVPPCHFSTLWWLALFIEALVLSPNIEREGRQQLAILKGNI